MAIDRTLLFTEMVIYIDLTLGVNLVNQLRSDYTRLFKKQYKK